MPQKITFNIYSKWHNKIQHYCLVIISQIMSYFGCFSKYLYISYIFTGEKNFLHFFAFANVADEQSYSDWSICGKTQEVAKAHMWLANVPEIVKEISIYSILSTLCQWFNEIREIWSIKAVLRSWFLCVKIKETQFEEVI